MKLQCECGSTEFVGHMVYHCDVVVDADREFVRDDGTAVTTTAGQNIHLPSIYEAGDPFGPYTCVKCGAECGDD